MTFINKHESPTHAIKEIVNNCAFAEPHEYMNGPYPRSMYACINSPREPMKALINHMRLNSANMDASFGSEFGSHVRVVYIPNRDLVLINPVTRTTEEDVPMIECHDVFGHTTIKEYRHKAISIDFLSETFTPSTIILRNKDACTIQAILDII